MTRKFFQLLFILTYLSSSAFAQFVSFEEEIPCNFKSSDKQELALSSSYYKEGSKSLEWKFSPNSILDRICFYPGGRQRNHSVDIQ